MTQPSQYVLIVPWPLILLLLLLLFWLTGTRGVRLSPRGGVCRSRCQSISTCGSSRCMNCSCGWRAPRRRAGSSLCCPCCTETHPDVATETWTTGFNRRLSRGSIIHRICDTCPHTPTHTHTHTCMSSTYLHDTICNSEHSYKDTRCRCLWTSGGRWSFYRPVTSRSPLDQTVCTIIPAQRPKPNPVLTDWIWQAVL